MSDTTRIDGAPEDRSWPGEPVSGDRDRSPESPPSSVSSTDRTEMDDAGSTEMEEMGGEAPCHLPLFWDVDDGPPETAEKRTDRPPRP